VNADHAVQLRLLDLQAADTALAQLAHRRKTLPELAAITEHDLNLDALRGDIVDAETMVSDLADDQRRLEAEIDTVRARETRDEQRLQAGGLPAKELEGLQHELVSLKRRQSTLEDELLDVMEQREIADSALSELSVQQTAIETERGDLAIGRDAAFAEIDESAARRTQERAGLVAEMPADLLALYEKGRAHSGGTGAAMLRHRRCEGCHIELSGGELASVRTAEPDLIVRCDNCRCILVRTPESGL
jgi:uncharacterized protein